MNIHYSFPFIKFICLILFCTSISAIGAQEDSELIDAYEDYVEAPRELVYLHLNKSTYIKGETIGFTAYVLDKKDKKPSLLTTNLYVSIEDKNQNTLKQKLIKVENGIAANTFEIDSSFSSDYYQIKAYTNWMRNFKEQNYFVESLRIIDPRTEKFIEKELAENKVDAQFLPESGHILHNVENNIGVVVKDNHGFGIANVKGEVLDKNNNLVTFFETNQFGIGRFSFRPSIDNHYTATITNANKDFEFNISKTIEKQGVILSIKKLKSKVFVSIITNTETLNSIKNKRYTLMVHNGDAYEIMDIYFNDKTTITKVIDTENSPGGVNILTLFNDNDTPIAERLFFNYKGINLIGSNTISAKRANDSLTINLNFNTIDTEKFNNLSVSVLPQETLSYNRHHNIISYTYLQPYIKGAIENAKYYFSNINDKKKYELDNLLITQGWSSYDWNTIFNAEPNQTFPFEQGISINANINSDKNLKDTYILHQLYNQEPRYVTAADGENSFVLPNIFPIGDENIFMSRLVDNKDLAPAQLYVQPFPNSIPQLTTTSNYLKPKSVYITKSSLNRNKLSFEKFGETQNLDEVIVESRIDRKRTRMRQLNKHSYGNVEIVDELDRQSFLLLSDFLRFKNLDVVEQNGTFQVFNKYVSTLNAGDNTQTGMLIYLDDMPLFNSGLLFRYNLNDVDYVEIDRRGFGYGVLGSNGVIRIYTNFDATLKTTLIKTMQKVKLPLVFSAKKKFYVPQYKYYQDDFYKGYGTIDWKPELVTDSNGNISVKIAQPKVPITLFIEGLANDGSFIFEEKSISLN